jgi:hypothetical protein
MVGTVLHVVDQLLQWITTVETQSALPGINGRSTAQRPWWGTYQPIKIVLRWTGAAERNPKNGSRELADLGRTSARRGSAADQPSSPAFESVKLSKNYRDPDSRRQREDLNVTPSSNSDPTQFIRSLIGGFLAVPALHG